jgi:hypothetical protein
MDRWIGADMQEPAGSGRRLEEVRAGRILLGLAASAALLPTPAHADLRPKGFAECGGITPAVVSCTTGNHLRTVFVEHGFHLTNAYTGTLESRLDWRLGVHIFRCGYALSVKQGCVESGSFPIPGSIYQHSCNSFILNSSTAGGSGAWNCYTLHSTGLY